MHLAGRLKIEQIEKEGFGHPNDFDILLLPGDSNWIEVKGKLRRVGTTALGQDMEDLIAEAEGAGMRCNRPNAHIRICEQPGS